MSQSPSKSQSRSEAQSLTLDQHIAEFEEFLGLKASLNSALAQAGVDFLRSLRGTLPVSTDKRRSCLLGAVNRKFCFNKIPTNEAIDAIAADGVFLNYHQKADLALAIDESDNDALEALAEANGLERDRVATWCKPIPQSETLSRLHSEIRSPTVTRSDSKPRDWSTEIVSSLFASYLFGSYPRYDCYAAFNVLSAPDDHGDYWSFLENNYGASFSRSRSLVYIDLSAPVADNELSRIISAEYDRLSNHGHLAMHLSGWGGATWHAASHSMLFAEKFVRRSPVKGYFQGKGVLRETLDHIDLDADDIDAFGKYEAGFTYRDTFVFGDNTLDSALLVFQKNEDDETLIPCPACRSENVRGNSYSSFGVKSWECANLLCPDRTKFNRGKRYSYLQLLKQQAIQDSRNTISRDSIRRWSRDVQPSDSAEHVTDMLIRHYSLAGDGVCLVAESDVLTTAGRTVTKQTLVDYVAGLPKNDGVDARFYDGAFFRRYKKRKSPAPTPTYKTTKVSNVEVRRGPCFDVLGQIPIDVFDGAVTSPPYYNAREYAQWPNIYTYLYDMYNDAIAAYGSLTPGAPYLYNIFDYFDNERIITFSAMGQKRLILSAYIINMFEDIGFVCEDNIVWDKGQIEGKRAFNQGNLSPYYQAPLNCWEHIIVFRKPGGSEQLAEWPAFLRKKPVFKIVRGQNVYGHTAPFPTDIPKLLTDRLPSNASLLDPYAGSGTTGIAALNAGQNALCIERDKEYADLAIKRLRDHNAQAPLL